MEILKAKEASKLLRIHYNTLLRLSARGDIPGKKVGSKWIYIEEDLLKWLRNDKNNFSELKMKKHNPNFNNSDYF